MLKIFGKVSNVSLNSIMVDINCMNTCFTQDDCFLAFFNSQNHCKLFNFNTTEALEVEKTSREEGLFVAFKVCPPVHLSVHTSRCPLFQTTLPNDTCPTYDSMIPVVNNGEDPVNWKKLGNMFSFQKCRGDWKMFRRSIPEVTVCMQVFLLGTGGGISRLEAVQYCESINTTLTGVATIEESKWLNGRVNWGKDRLKKLYPGAQKWEGVWMDGIRNCTGFKEPNCRNYDWSDGYTEGLDALGLSNARLSYTGDSGKNENCLKTFIYYAPLTINCVNCDRTSRLDIGAFSQKMYSWTLFFLFVIFFWNLPDIDAMEQVTLTPEGRQVAAWVIVLGVIGGIAVSASIAGGIFMMNRRRANEVLVVR
ncbi:hypothetical protein CRE_18164 [Caenorhabditis remanei]|uniref:PAN-3 domain-containing protein n=1 Tax=Caenorhabditis remanei TaxID=31234 RepID=E3N8K5_CAERE|nr:hypothetical protein CRE_18164 [Caenorhabditis remanei]